MITTHKIKIFIQVLLFFFCIWMTVTAQALRFPLPAVGNSLFGQVQFYQIQPGDEFAKIAKQFDIGFYALSEANPQIDANHLVPGTMLVIPTQHVLPMGYRTGIVINLASMQLFYFPPHKNYFYIYPIGIGRENWTTPVGVLQVLQKIKDPKWVVPKSIYDFRIKHGDPVPKVIPAGPNNPLGEYALRLSKPTYLIHGTNDPASVGLRSSAGCIHLYPEDIKELFEMTPLHTSVFIINLPYIMAWDKEHLYLEAHIPLQEQRKLLSNVAAVTNGLINGIIGNYVFSAHTSLVEEMVKEHTGIPSIVGELQSNESKGAQIPPPEALKIPSAKK